MRAISLGASAWQRQAGGKPLLVAVRVRGAFQLALALALAPLAQAGRHHCQPEWAGSRVDPRNNSPHPADRRCSVRYTPHAFPVAGPSDPPKRFSPPLRCSVRAEGRIAVRRKRRLASVASHARVYRAGRWRPVGGRRADVLSAWVHTSPGGVVDCGTGENGSAEGGCGCFSPRGMRCSEGEGERGREGGREREREQRHGAQTVRRRCCRVAAGKETEYTVKIM